MREKERVTSVVLAQASEWIVVPFTETEKTGKSRLWRKGRVLFATRKSEVTVRCTD